MRLVVWCGASKVVGGRDEIDGTVGEWLNEKRKEMRDAYQEKLRSKKRAMLRTLLKGKPKRGYKTEKSQ